MSRYLVTGGAGFLGRGLVRALVTRGDVVRVLDNESRGRVSQLGDLEGRVEFMAGDIRDAETVLRACQGVERVCHLAFINGTEYFYTMPEQVLEVGVKGMMNVLDGCLKAGVGDLAVASSSEVYHLPPRIPTDETAPLSIPDPLNPRYSYAGAKIISELLAINYGRKHLQRVVIFRPHNVFGPEMGHEHVIPQFVLRMAELAATQTGIIRFPIQGTGHETRAFIFIDDFVAGLLKVLDRGEHLQIYHIGTEAEITIAALAEAVALHFRREAVLVPGDPAPGGTPRRCPDISKLKRLGFEPRIPFAEGLRRTVEWYVENAGTQH
jgi:nucleoside-diphosphate-sugar epimerase